MSLLFSVLAVVLCVSSVSSRVSDSVHTAKHLRLARQADAVQHPHHVQCAYRTDDVIGVKNCTLPADKEPSDWLVACYYLEYDGKITQDCWIHQELAVLDQCTPRACDTVDSNAGVHFCCCFGDRCNSEDNVDGPK